MPDPVVTDGVPDLRLVTFILFVCLNQLGESSKGTVENAVWTAWCLLCQVIEGFLLIFIY